MAINGLSVGRSWTANIFTQFGEFVIPTVISFNVHSNTETPVSTAVDGHIRYVSIPHGFSGTLQADRQNNAIEEYWLSYEKAYYDGLNLLPSTITQTIQEADGSITQLYAYGVMFHNPDFGNWMGTDIIKQSIAFNAERLKVIR